MTSGFLIQILFDLCLLATVAFLWVKMHRPQKDDPRLSRGLQLLQSKIAVLEDLSDQIETQVQQITALMDAKGNEVRTQILNADKQIQKIETSMGKSLEVAKIFQDRIPHQEIIERQNTMKYVKAARLAHQGVPLEEIALQVDLSRGEIELIVKVNRNQLQFSEEDLPAWAKHENAEVAGDDFESVPLIHTVPQDFQEATLENPLARIQDKGDLSLADLGEKFRQTGPREIPKTVVGNRTNSSPLIEMPAPSAVSDAASMTPAPAKERAVTTSGKNVEIQKVVFPRLDMNQHLS